MNYEYINPSKVLQPFIKYYWILEDNKKTDNVCQQRIFPTGFIEVIFYYGDPYFKISKNSCKELQPKSQINGHTTGYYDVLPAGKVGLLSAVLHPNAARLFFDLPITEFTNQSVNIADLKGDEINAIEDQLQAATNNMERINAVEKYFFKKLIEKKLYDFKKINNCISKINLKKGIISIPELANESFLSQKQFNRKFSEFVGLNPKQFLRIIRFQHAIFSYQNNPSVNFTELAYACGYFDQSHFIHEFKTFTGLTPTELFKNCQPYSDYFSQ